jgi:DNA-binding transcriptional MerR regulator
VGCSASGARNGATASDATINKGPLTYTAVQAASLTGCTVSQIRHWMRSGIVAASAGGDFTFRDLVSLRVLRSLLDAGLPSARVRAAIVALRDVGEADLASLRIVTDGRDVWACHDDGQILDALRHGQLALFIAVDRVSADVDAEVRSFQAERAAFVDTLMHPSHGGSSQ